MKNGYIHIWEDSLSSLIGRINCYNREPEEAGRTYELIQILPNPAEFEHWIGIVKVSTPKSMWGPDTAAAERPNADECSPLGDDELDAHKHHFNPEEQGEF